MNRIDLPDLFQQAFNTRPIFLLPRSEQKQGALRSGLVNHGYEKEYPQSLLGTPVINQVTIGPGNDPITGQRVEALTLPDITMIDVTVAKEIVKTQVQGRDYTVKEFISHSDPSIRCRGFILNLDSLDPPYDQVEQIYAMMQVRAAVPVASDLLSVLGVSWVVMEDLRISEIEGRSNVLAYDLRMSGDLPEETQIQNDL